jgi:hypothetical protein
VRRCTWYELGVIIRVLSTIGRDTTVETMMKPKFGLDDSKKGGFTWAWKKVTTGKKNKTVARQWQLRCQVSTQLERIATSPHHDPTT